MSFPWWVEYPVRSAELFWQKERLHEQYSPTEWNLHIRNLTLYSSHCEVSIYKVTQLEMFDFQPKVTRILAILCEGELFNLDYFTTTLMSEFESFLH